MRAGANRDGNNAFVQTDAMFEVDNQIALTERRQLLDKGIAALAALGFADEPVAENILLGEQGQAFGSKTRGEWQNCQRHCRGCRKAGIPIITKYRRLDAMVFEQVKDARPRTLAVTCDYRRGSGLCQSAQMSTQRLINILVAGPFRRKITRRRDRHREHGCRFWFVKFAQNMDRCVILCGPPFVWRKIEHLRR